MKKRKNRIFFILIRVWLYAVDSCFNVLSVYSLWWCFRNISKPFKQCMTFWEFTCSILQIIMIKISWQNIAERIKRQKKIKNKGQQEKSFAKFEVNNLFYVNLFSAIHTRTQTNTTEKKTLTKKNKNLNQIKYPCRQALNGWTIEQLDLTIHQSIRNQTNRK